MSHSCCEAAIDEVLEGSEAKRILLPEFIDVHMNNTTADRKGERTCQETQLKETLWVWQAVNRRNKKGCNIYTSSD